ncbi:hypothetical protein INR49_011426 [Caranx melampygus]|nr:hypothetical protein INR49_011426 [Caranx melampygus]
MSLCPGLAHLFRLNCSITTECRVPTTEAREAVLRLHLRRQQHQSPGQSGTVTGDTRAQRSMVMMVLHENEGVWMDRQVKHKQHSCSSEA